MKKPPKPVRHHAPPVVHGGQFVPRRSHAKPPNPVRANFGGGQFVPRGKKPVHKKPRKLSPGWDVACCSAQALGTLLGWDADDVLALYWRTASDPDAGATILDTLQAATVCGLFCPAPGNVVPEISDTRWPVGPVPGTGRHTVDVVVSTGTAFACAADAPVSAVRRAAKQPHGLILGVTLPEPHSIAVTLGGGWWSWGEPFDPAAWPDLTIEEAWAVTW